jgi:hypothetical protein
MSTTVKNNNNSNETLSTISEAEDMKMFQASRRAGRRNALGDLSEQLAQGEYYSLQNIFLKIFIFFLVGSSSSSSAADKMAPRFQTMSLKP